MISIHRRRNNGSKHVLRYLVHTSSQFYVDGGCFASFTIPCTTRVREAPPVSRSYTCRALPHAALTSRRRRRRLFVTYPHQTDTPSGVRYAQKVYPVDRVRARCAIRGRLLGARSQEAEMVLCVFQLVPSGINTTSYIRTHHTFALVPEGRIWQLHISQVSK